MGFEVHLRFGWARFAWFPTWLALIKFRGEILGAAILDIFIAVLRNSGQVHPWVQPISCLRYSTEQLLSNKCRSWLASRLKSHPMPPVSNERRFSLFRPSRNEFQSQIFTAPRLQFISCRYLQPQNGILSSFSSLSHQTSRVLHLVRFLNASTTANRLGSLIRRDYFLPGWKISRRTISRRPTRNSKSHTLWTCPGQSGAILLTFRHEISAADTKSDRRYLH